MTAAMTALDVFCAAGGATPGLMQAGFDVTGVHLHPEPNYRGDASQFDFIWASPPCQRFTALKTAPGAKGDANPNLIGPTREPLKTNDVPWVIENVEGAPLVNPVRLCGTAFSLGARTASIALGEVVSELDQMIETHVERARGFTA